MEHSELETALVAEGKSFAAKYPNLTGDKEFISNIAKAFNGDTFEEGALTHAGVVKHFALMHGYLEKAYIDGFGDATDPEWSHTRTGSWNRWVKYLRFVENYPRDKAIAFAKRFFYAVDSVSAYS